MKGNIEELRFLMEHVLKGMYPEQHISCLLERALNENSVHIFTFPQGGFVESQLPKEYKNLNC